MPDEEHFWFTYLNTKVINQFLNQENLCNKNSEL